MAMGPGGGVYGEGGMHGKEGMHAGGVHSRKYAWWEGAACVAG